jgi:uncharacterized membrane protein
MKRSVRQIAFVLLLFFIVGMVAVFAFSEDDYNFYYKQGYLDGYAGVSRRTVMSYPDMYDKLRAYNSGYAQGEADKAAGKVNYFMQ